MQRRIVFINQATGYLTIDIINEFAKEFEKVALITGSVRIQDVSLDKKVHVSYITKYNRGNTFKKLASWLLGTVQIYSLLVVRYRKFERFYFTIPPTSYLLANHFRSLYAVVVYDLYPDALLTYGFNSRGLIYKWWLKRNERAFTRAHKIFTLSERMKSQILAYASRSKVTVISNWAAFNDMPCVVKEKNKLINEHNLQGKFIVQYSGNIGVTHRVEVLIEAAELLASYEDIIFLIIGRGDRMKTIGSMIQNKKLKNCMLLRFRKDDELFDSLCAADLAVITLDDRTPDISVPSKTYNIMVAGLPIMAIAAKTSEISEMIDKHGNGKSFDKNDLEGMCRFITELKNNPDYRITLSKKSLAAAQNYTRKNAKEYCEIYLNQ
ncbi:MAG: glycosyltransferase family 4 protein [Bacteroidales bacterium]|nr:glycosyltransferase family 4 protein [Bacteroidales bacterium]